MKSYTILIVLFISLISGCSSSDTNPQNEVLFPSPTERNQKDIRNNSIELETLAIDSVESSYLGYLKMDNDTIYLIDKKFCWVFRFTKEGQLIDRVLGLGEGPKEYNSGIIEGYCRLPDNRWIFVDTGNGCNFFTNTFDRKNRLQIIKNGDREDKSYENPMVYTLNYGSFIMKQMGDYIYYNVNAWQGMAEDFMVHPKNYFQNVHILVKMNIKTGEVEKMLGGFPPFYERKHSVFQEVSFDIEPQKEHFFISYDADSLIYCYDKEYKPLYSFGWQGKDMKTDYYSFSWDILLKRRDEIRSKYSYYHDITYIKELGLLFRPYTKNPESEYDGLQIYQGQVLIADVAVPRNLSILGYSAPYIYATSGMDGISESIDVYRFKLERK